MDKFAALVFFKGGFSEFCPLWAGQRAKAADGQGVQGEGGEGTPRHLQRRSRKFFLKQIYLLISDPFWKCPTALLSLHQRRGSAVIFCGSGSSIFSKCGSQSSCLKNADLDPAWTSVSDPHKFSCGSGSRITKMSIWIRMWIRIQGGKHKRIITQKNLI